MTPELWAIALKEDTVRAGPNEREIIVATPRSEVLLVAVDTNQLEIFRKAIYVALTRVSGDGAYAFAMERPLTCWRFSVYNTSMTLDNQ